MYRTLSQHYRSRFGCKVYKLAIDAGFTCPNRDGSISFAAAASAPLQAAVILPNPEHLSGNSWRRQKNV